jgi:nicotinamidase-related amidase
MPQTLDFAKRALLLIDVQNEYVDGALPIEYPPLESSLAHIARAAAAAVEAKSPIVLVRQNAPATSPAFATGSRGWQLHASVADLPSALLVDKLLPSALTATPLAEWLRGQKIGTLTVAGFMTQNCDESTIRQAVHEGWAVEFLHDAAGAVSYANAQGFASARTIHETACIVLQSRFAKVMSTQQWLAMLAGGEAPQGDTILASVLRARREKAPA